jgi:hypothetical protein
VRFVRNDVQPLFARRGPDSVISSGKFNIGPSKMAVLLFHRDKKLKVRKSDASRKAFVKVLDIACGVHESIVFSRLISWHKTLDDI